MSFENISHTSSSFFSRRSDGETDPSSIIGLVSRRSVDHMATRYPTTSTSTTHPSTTPLDINEICLSKETKQAQQYVIFGLVYSHLDVIPFPLHAIAQWN